MAVTAETLALSDQLRSAVGGEADQVTRAETDRWNAAWAALAPAMLAAIVAGQDASVSLDHWPRPWDWSRIPAAASALGAATAALTTLASAGAAAASAGATRAIDATVAAEPAIIASQMPPTMQPETESSVVATAATIAVGAIAAAAAARIAATVATIPADVTAALTRALYIGAADLLPVLRAAFLGGLTSIITTARTEILDAYRAASKAIHDGTASLLGGWLWVCRRDTRVCPACLAMHGTRFPTSTPGPIDHPHGRCQRVPLVRSWRSLGLAIPEPDAVIPDVRGWFATLPEVEQVAILGRGRLALLRSGLITWDDIPRRRTSAEWRDSYRPATLAELQRLAARRNSA